MCYHWSCNFNCCKSIQRDFLNEYSVYGYLPLVILFLLNCKTSSYIKKNELATRISLWMFSYCVFVMSCLSLIIWFFLCTNLLSPLHHK
jgi:hypothetical protein